MQKYRPSEDRSKTKLSEAEIRSLKEKQLEIEEFEKNSTKYKTNESANEEHIMSKTNILCSNSSKLMSLDYIANQNWCSCYYEFGTSW